MKTITVTEDESIVMQFALILYAAESESDLATLKNSGRNFNRPAYNSAMQRKVTALELHQKLSLKG